MVSGEETSVVPPAVGDATYDEIMTSAPAVAPVPFPAPRMRKGTLFRTPVHVPNVGDEKNEEEVNFVEDHDDDSDDEDLARPSLDNRNQSDTFQHSINKLIGTNKLSGHVLVPPTAEGEEPRAYWIQRKVSKTTYGWIRVGYVLRPYSAAAASRSDQNKRVKTTNVDSEGGEDVEWEVTPKAGGTDFEMVTVNVYERSKISAFRGRRMEDPMVELSVSQMIADSSDPEESFVLGTIDVLETELHIYRIVPYAREGTLLDYVVKQGRIEEPVARHFFRQIMKGLQLFQRLGVCHRDLSLANVIVCNGDAYIVGNTKSLRVPYLAAAPDGSLDGGDVVTDATQGTIRRLITPQGPCGQPTYMAPEILASNDNFDAHAIDLWSAGIMLFHMLYGKPPFVWAAKDDPRFHAVCVRGNLRSIVSSVLSESITGLASKEPATVSEEGLDLMQGMLRLDPRDRFTLNQILAHAWLTDGKDERPSPLRRFHDFAATAKQPAIVEK